MVTKLITLAPEMELREAAKRLLKHQISGAPVVDSTGELVDIFSAKDLLTALIDAAYEQLPSSEVRAYMTRDLHTIPDDLDLLSIAQLFQRNDFRRLPVVCDGKLVGQISRRDVMRAVIELLEPVRDHHKALLYLSALRETGQPPFE